jgi:hypothetical protein
MKMKLIAAAALAMTSSLSFAATVLTCDTTTAAKMTNTCLPEASLFVAGSSALGGNINAILPDLFDTTKRLIKIVDTSASGVANGNAAATTAWYGTSKAGATGGVAKRVYVVYNNNNGSAAGVSLVMGKLAKTGNPPEANVVNVGPTKTIPNTCVDAATPTSTTTINGISIAHDVVNCSQTLDRNADLAFTDVRVQELYALYAMAAKAKVADAVQVPLGMLGFGLAVNWNMYQALQTAQSGKNLPASCVAGDLTAACVPNIRRIDYATLVTSVMPDSNKSAKLFGLDDSLITLARRDDLSGTQATSNMFFANNACGNVPLKSTNLGGKLDIVGTVDQAKFKSVMHNTSSAVRTALGSSTGYAIGMANLEWRTGSSWPNGPVKASTYNFVKIDNYSPLFNADGSVAYKARTAFANGDYPLAVTAYAVYPKLFDTKPSDKTTLAKFVFNAMKDSTKGDMNGLAYIDGVADAADSTTPKQANVKQPGGNNCSPLIRM